MQTPSLFYRLGKFGPFGFVVEGEKKILYFILLFVGKHLKEIEGLNDKGCAFSLMAHLLGAAHFRRCPGEGMP